MAPDDTDTRQRGDPRGVASLQELRDGLASAINLARDGEPDAALSYLENAEKDLRHAREAFRDARDD